MNISLTAKQIRTAHMFCRGIDLLHIALSDGSSEAAVYSRLRWLRKEFGVNTRLEFVNKCIEENLILKEQAVFEPVEWPIKGNLGRVVLFGKELTESEKRVISLLGAGKQNQEAAEIIGISVKTVEKHRQSVYYKLGINNTAQLVHYALIHNLVDLGSCLPKKEEALVA